MLDPYWQKQDFLRRNPQFETPADPITSAGQVSVPEEEISSSPEISFFSNQTRPPSTYETGQVSNSRPLANGLFDDISDPELDLANELPTTNSAPSLSLTNGEAVRELSQQQPVADFSFYSWRASAPVLGKVYNVHQWTNLLSKESQKPTTEEATWAGSMYHIARIY